MLLRLLAGIWQPLIDAKKDSPWLTRVMIEGQVYSGEYICRPSAWMLSCPTGFLFLEPSSYDSPSCFCEFIMTSITFQLCILPIVMHLMCAKTYSRDDIELDKEFCILFDIMLFAILVIGCSVHQMMTALTCLPSAVFFGSHFISTLGVQLTGFFGCLAIAGTLGVMFPIQPPLASFEKPLANQSSKGS